MGPVLESVRRTGRAVVVHEATVNLGLGSELAARITDSLDELCGPGGRGGPGDDDDAADDAAPSTAPSAGTSSDA